MSDDLTEIEEGLKQQALVIAEVRAMMTNTFQFMPEAYPDLFAALVASLLDRLTTESVVRELQSLNAKIDRIANNTRPSARG